MRFSVLAALAILLHCLGRSIVAAPPEALVQRHPRNPVIQPADLPFRAVAVFNSGAAVYQGRIYMVLNCWDSSWTPIFLIAHSADGISFQIGKENVLPKLKDRDNHVIDALRYSCEGARRAAKAHGTPHDFSKGAQGRRAAL